MYDEDTLAALERGDLVLRDFLTIYGWDGDGDPVIFAFWTGEDNVTANVVTAIDGSTVSRNFIGGGSLPESGVPAIVDAIGLEARAVTFDLNQLHGSTLAMLRANNIRVGGIELHRGLYDPDTWSLVADPLPRFLGRVDGARIVTPAVGGEGSMPITAVADTIDLTRTSPALKSDESQRQRSGDRFFRHSDTAGAVEVWWGLARGSA